jgi:hypothetical protein
MSVALAAVASHRFMNVRGPLSSCAQTGIKMAGQTEQAMHRGAEGHPEYGSGAVGLKQNEGGHCGGANAGQLRQHPALLHVVRPSVQSSAFLHDGVGPHWLAQVESAASMRPSQSSSFPLLHCSRAPGFTVASLGAQSPPGIPWHA